MAKTMTLKARTAAVETAPPVVETAAVGTVKGSLLPEHREKVQAIYARHFRGNGKGGFSCDATACRKDIANALGIGQNDARRILETLRHESGTLASIRYTFDRKGNGYTIEKRANGRFDQSLADAHAEHLAQRKAIDVGHADKVKSLTVVACANMTFDASRLLA